MGHCTERPDVFNRFNEIQDTHGLAADERKEREDREENKGQGKDPEGPDVGPDFRQPSTHRAAHGHLLLLSNNSFRAGTEVKESPFPSDTSPASHCVGILPVWREPASSAS